MAGGRSRPSITKKQKERKRQERKQQKLDRLARRRATREQTSPEVRDDDPDIAGIVPGPQPLPWEN